MRVLSPYANYMLHVISPVVKRASDERGVLREYEEGIEVVAEFRKTGLLEHEIEAALTTFNFAGLPDQVNPLTRISCWDSEAYCEERFGDDPELKAEMLERIDNRLRKLSEIRGPSYFMIVETPAAPIPWPSYDECSAEEVIEWQAKLRIPAEKVRLYEAENKGRKTIISEMFRVDGMNEEGVALSEVEGEVVKGATISA